MQYEGSLHDTDYILPGMTFDQLNKVHASKRSTIDVYPFIPKIARKTYYDNVVIGPINNENTPPNPQKDSSATMTTASIKSPNVLDTAKIYRGFTETMNNQAMDDYKFDFMSYMLSYSDTILFRRVLHNANEGLRDPDNENQIVTSKKDNGKFKQLRNSLLQNCFAKASTAAMNAKFKELYYLMTIEKKYNPSFQSYPEDLLAYHVNKAQNTQKKEEFGMNDLIG
jgi:hypothetical protein